MSIDVSKEFHENNVTDILTIMWLGTNFLELIMVIIFNQFDCVWLG